MLEFGVRAKSVTICGRTGCCDRGGRGLGALSTLCSGIVSVSSMLCLVDEETDWGVHKAARLRRSSIALLCVKIALVLMDEVRLLSIISW